MQNKPDFKRELCCLAWGLLAAALAVLACCWTGYDLTDRLSELASYTLINDDYTRYADLTEQGLTQLVPVPAGEPVYGVRLKFDTHNTAYPAGEVQVELLTQAGQSLGAVRRDYRDIIGDVFVAFPLEDAYIPAADETLTVRITATQPWPGVVSLWCSAEEKDGMPLYSGDTAVGATLAVQQITAYAGQWPMRKALQLALPLGLGAFLAAWLLRRRAALPWVTAAVALCLGCAFVQVTPALTAPDEYTHLAVCYEKASRLSAQPTQGQDGKLLLRECDAPYFGTKTGKIGVLAYKQADTARRTQPGSPNVTTVTGAPQAGQSGNGYYAPQVLGILLARALGKNFYTMLAYGRMANLLVYALLAALAVALAPKAAQGILTAAALLPMPLQLAGSLSPDALLIGLVFCYLALCLRLRTHKAAAWELVLLAVLAAVNAPNKAIYLPAVLLCLMIPPQNLLAGTAGKTAVLRGHLWQAGVLGLAAASWCAANLGTALRFFGSHAGLGGVAALLIGAVAAACVLAVLCAFEHCRRRNTEKRFWLVFALGVLAAAAAVFAVARRMPVPTPEMMVERLPNGESPYCYTVPYACHYVTVTLKMLVRSAVEQSPLWLQGILGTTLGEPIVYRIDVSWLIGLGLVLALAVAALPVQGSTPLLGRHTAWGVAGTVLCVVCAAVVVSMSWTPLSYTVLFGLQGRYLLPMLPAVLLPAKNAKGIFVPRDTAYPACAAVSTLTLLTILQGFGLYAGWQGAL